MTRLHWQLIKIYLFVIIVYFLYSNQIILIPMLPEKPADQAIEPKSEISTPLKGALSSQECPPKTSLNQKTVQKKTAEIPRKQPADVAVQPPKQKKKVVAKIAPQTRFPAVKKTVAKKTATVIPAPPATSEILPDPPEPIAIQSKQQATASVETVATPAIPKASPVVAPEVTQKKKAIEVEKRPSFAERITTGPSIRADQIANPILVDKNNKWQAKVINKRDVKGETALSQAVEKNDLMAVQDLLEKGANPNLTVESPSCDSVVFYCKLSAPPISLVKSVQALRLLLKTGADPNLEDSAEYPPLFYALLLGDEAVVQLLIDVGAEFRLDRNTMLAIQLNPKIAPMVAGHFPERKATIFRRAGQKKSVDYFTIH